MVVSAPGTSIVFDMYKLLDLKLILGPLFAHVVFASVLRAVGLYPFVADKCLWMGASSAILFIWWYLLGFWPSALEGNASDILRRVPEFIERIEWAILIQWYLVIYFITSLMFSHSFSRKGWIIPRKFVGASLLFFCLWKDWTPPSMVVKCVYLIMKIMAVDLAIDFYYLVESFKDASEFDRRKRDYGGSFLETLLKIAFPVGMVSWLLFVVKDVYIFLVEHQAPTLIYSIIVGYALFIQLSILSPLAWKPKRRNTK